MTLGQTVKSSRHVGRPRGSARAARVVVYAVSLLVCLTIIAVPAHTWITNLATDDALYYPTVARAIATGAGSTYDGITMTNGYHPLWCWLQIPIAAIVGPLGSMTYLWVVKLFMALVVASGLVVWERAIRSVTGSTWLSATFVLLLGSYWWSVYTLYSGMETPLVVLLMGACILLATRTFRERSTGAAVALGVAMAATLLARLDSIFFLAVLGCVMLVFTRHNPRLLAGWSLPAALLPVPYLLWNYAMFGNFVPVSGIKKSASDLDLADQFGILLKFGSDKVAKLVGFVHPVGVILLLIVLIAGIWATRRELRQHAAQLRILWVLPAAALLHFGYVAMFMVEANIYWYQYCEYLTVFLVISVLVAAAASWLQNRRPHSNIQWAPFAVVFVAVVGILLTYAPQKMPNMVNLRSYETAIWAKDHMGQEDLRFGMMDPGVFRYVSGFDTLALNGLAGDRDVLTLVKQEKWKELINRYDVAYVVQFVPEDDIAGIPAEHMKYRSDPFTFRKEEGRFLILDSNYWTETSFR
jgi:hypothetical protein